MTTETRSRLEMKRVKNFLAKYDIDNVDIGVMYSKYVYKIEIPEERFDDLVENIMEINELVQDSECKSLIDQAKFLYRLKNNDAI